MNPSWKTSSGYYPELPQPSKAGQHSNPGNTEITTEVVLKKSKPKAHNHQIHQGSNEEKNARAAREKGWVAQ